MEPVRKYDVLAFSLLLFAAVLAVWMGFFGPTNTTLWRHWQPLMASAATLAAAGIVFRGATLAYRAAMAKVDLDRDIHLQEVRRRKRGIFLRTAFAAHIMHHEAARFAKWLSEGPPKGEPLYATHVNLRTMKVIDKAWLNLDAFGKEVAADISRVKVQLYNVEEAQRNLGEAGCRTGPANLGDSHEGELHRALELIAKYCLRIRDSLETQEKSMADA